MYHAQPLSFTLSITYTNADINVQLINDHKLHYENIYTIVITLFPVYR